MDRLPEGYEIRNAQEHDIPALQQVDLAASALFKPTGLIDDGPDGPTSIPANALHAGIEAALLLVVVNPDRVPVGFVLSRKQSPDLYLEQVSVDPAYGRLGLGRALVTHAIQTADDLRLRGVVLSTFRDLAWNGPFYRSLGFEELLRKDMKPWMLRLERIQSQSMDVGLRCFMRRPGAWNRHWIRLTARSRPKSPARSD